jgi:uncharacterized membrane protein YheB (UPF0754 family)
VLEINATEIKVIEDAIDNTDLTSTSKLIIEISEDKMKKITNTYLI